MPPPPSVLYLFMPCFLGSLIKGVWKIRSLGGLPGTRAVRERVGRESRDCEEIPCSVYSVHTHSAPQPSPIPTNSKAGQAKGEEGKCSSPHSCRFPHIPESIIQAPFILLPPSSTPLSKPEVWHRQTHRHPDVPTPFCSQDPNHLQQETEEQHGIPGRSRVNSLEDAPI